MARRTAIASLSKTTEFQELLLSTKIVRMPIHDAIEFLTKKGFKLSVPGYYKAISVIDENFTKRTFDIAKNYAKYRIEKLDTLKTVHRRYWDIIRDPDSEIRDVITCLKNVTELQPYLSAYEESIQKSIEEPHMTFADANKFDDSKMPALEVKEIKIIGKRRGKGKKKSKQQPPLLPLADLLTLTDSNALNAQDTPRYPPKQW